VRQGDEGQVTVGDRVGLEGVEPPVRQPGHACQLRMDDADRLAGLAVRGDRAELDVRMAGQQAQDLAPGVAACAGHGHPRSHASS
jgi:hypothetical protein